MQSCNSARLKMEIKGLGKWLIEQLTLRLLRLCLHSGKSAKAVEQCLKKAVHF